MFVLVSVSGVLLVIGDCVLCVVIVNCINVVDEACPYFLFENRVLVYKRIQHLMVGCVIRLCDLVFVFAFVVVENRVGVCVHIDIDIGVEAVTGVVLLN